MDAQISSLADGAGGETRALEEPGHSLPMISAPALNRTP